MDERRLAAIHSRALTAYRAGCTKAEEIIGEEDRAFLKSIGLTSQIIYDYVEDYSRREQPTVEDFLRVAAIRNEYFRNVQRERWEEQEVPEEDLPLRETQLEGIAWLPRIIRKAHCFLTGTLSREVMYGCRGDLRFLNEHGLNLVDFLTTVRDSKGDEAQILRYVRSGSR